MSLETIHLTVDTGYSRFRLEDYLFDQFPNLSRMYIRDVIKDESCEVNGRVENKGKRIRTGDFIEIELDLKRETAMRPEKMRLDIVYEDEDLIIVNKPAGMLVHPTHRDKSGTLLNGLTFYLNHDKTSGVIRPGLVHRLDKETSGLMVVAKNLKNHRALSRQFQRKLVEKKYLALVEGSVGTETGTVEAPIGRFADEKLWDVKPGAKPSVTRFRVIERLHDATLLEMEPVTGRTNQLRIHCASIGHPIVGDVARGGRQFIRLCLHAFSLEFAHPTSGKQLKFEVSPPPDFAL